MMIGLSDNAKDIRMNMRQEATESDRKDKLQNILIIEFSDRTAAEKFYYSDKYQLFKEERNKGSFGALQLLICEEIAVVIK